MTPVESERMPPEVPRRIARRVQPCDGSRCQEAGRVRAAGRGAAQAVEYELTALGLSLGAAFCGVWVWAAEHLAAVGRARASFDGAAGP